MMRDKEGANLAFSTAMTRHPRLQDGWLSWGSFCDKQHEAARALDNGGIRPQPYLENAVACYLQVGGVSDAPPPPPPACPGGGGGGGIGGNACLHTECSS